MSNTHLEVIIEKNWRSQNFDFLSLQNSSPSHVLGKLQLTQISLNFKTSCCIIRYYDVLKSKSRYKTTIYTLIKTKRNRKWKISHTILERRTLCFSSFENHKLKVKLSGVGARDRKKVHFFKVYFVSRKLF